MCDVAQGQFNWETPHFHKSESPSQKNFCHDKNILRYKSYAQIPVHLISIFILNSHYINY